MRRWPCDLSGQRRHHPPEAPRRGPGRRPGHGPSGQSRPGGPPPRHGGGPDWPSPAGRRPPGCSTSPTRSGWSSPSTPTHGLNIAIKTLAKPGGRVVLSGYEHNAVTPAPPRRPRPGAGGGPGRPCSTKRPPWTPLSGSWTGGPTSPCAPMCPTCSALSCPSKGSPPPAGTGGAPHRGRLPVRRLSGGGLPGPGGGLHRHAGAQGALRPQGTGLLLCGADPVPLLEGGTGSESQAADHARLPPRPAGGGHPQHPRGRPACWRDCASSTAGGRRPSPPTRGS